MVKSQKQGNKDGLVITVARSTRCQGNHPGSGKSSREFEAVIRFRNRHHFGELAVRGGDQSISINLSEEKLFEIFTEFLFFFLHFTSRQAYGRLPQAKANNLQQTIGEFISSSVVDVFLGHWPGELKTRIRSELYANLNQAEQEYAICKQLSVPILPPGRVRIRLDDTAMLSRLAFHALSKLRQEELDAMQIDTETAVLADMVQTVVMAKLVDGKARLNSESLPDISWGTLKALGLLVDSASAALVAHVMESHYERPSGRPENCS